MSLIKPLFAETVADNCDLQIKSNHDYLRGIVNRLVLERNDLTVDLIIKLTLANDGTLLDINSMLEEKRRSLLEEIEFIKQALSNIDKK